MLKPLSLLLVLFTVLGALLCGCRGQEPQTNAGSTALPTEAAPEWSEEPHEKASAYIEATLYYLSDEGYVVPVKKLIPREEGIAKACLGYMTSSPVNDAAAAKLGLKNVLPMGCEYTLSIQNGEAKLDFTSLAPFASAKEERAMLDAVVDTLTGFATVDRVTITKNGASGFLPNGAELPVMSPARMLNIEDSELAASTGAEPGTLYFANESGALTVPVTRYFGSKPSLYTLVSALIDGPKGRGLACCFPKGTLLLGAAMENGVVTVNLSSDFKAVQETEGLYALAEATLLETCAEGFGAQRVVIQINGEPYEP